MLRLSIFLLFLNIIINDCSFADIWPISGSSYTPDSICSCFGPRLEYDQYGQLVYGFHDGLDLVTIQENLPVKCWNDGYVYAAGYLPEPGNYVKIEHPGNIYTGYCHLNQIWVEEGDEVFEYETLGLSGNTGHSSGPHLHFAYSRIVGSNFVYNNPLHVLPNECNTYHSHIQNTQRYYTWDYLDSIKFDIVTDYHFQEADQDLNFVELHIYDEFWGEMRQDTINFDEHLPGIGPEFNIYAGFIGMDPVNYRCPNNRVIHCTWDFWGWPYSIPYDRWEDYTGIKVDGINRDCPNGQDCHWGNTSGLSPVVGIDELSGEGLLPDEFAIDGISPNPFNSSANISYSLDGKVALELDIGIYDILGRQAAKLKNEIADPGRYSLRFDGQNNQGEQLSNGIYFIKIDWGDRSVTKKITLLK
jgi:hypothetical protein